MQCFGKERLLIEFSLGNCLSIREFLIDLFLRDELDPSWVPCWDLMSTHLGVLFGQSILSVDVAVGVFLPVLLSPSQLERADRKQKVRSL